MRPLAATFSLHGSSSCRLRCPCLATPAAAPGRDRVTALCRGTRSWGGGVPGVPDSRLSVRGICDSSAPRSPKSKHCWELCGTSPSPVQGSLALGQQRSGPRRHAPRSARLGITSRRGAERRSQGRLRDGLPAAGRRTGRSPGRLAAARSGRSRRGDSARRPPQPPPPAQ